MHSVFSLFNIGVLHVREKYVPVFKYIYIFSLFHVISYMTVILKSIMKTKCENIFTLYNYSIFYLFLSGKSNKSHRMSWVWIWNFILLKFFPLTEHDLHLQKWIRVRVLKCIFTLFNHSIFYLFVRGKSNKSLRESCICILHFIMSKFWHTQNTTWIYKIDSFK